MEVASVAMEAPVHLDEVAVKAFLTTDYPRIVSAVALVAGSQAAAEDAVAEALARAWERSDHGEQIDSLPAWVTRVALNLAKSRLRRLRVEARHRASPEATAEHGDDRVDVERALATLPRREREATVLRYHLDLSVAEIAATLGVTEGTVKTLLYRARRHLAATLGEPEPDPGEEIEP